jgi:hypothetical protein
VNTATTGAYVSTVKTSATMDSIVPIVKSAKKPDMMFIYVRASLALILTLGLIVPSSKRLLTSITGQANQSKAY